MGFTHGSVDWPHESECVVGVIQLGEKNDTLKLEGKFAYGFGRNAPGSHIGTGIL